MQTMRETRVDEVAKVALHDRRETGASKLKDVFLQQILCCEEHAPNES